MKTNLLFDLSKFTKVEDIIYFDEPILSHLMLDDKNYFLYLVDKTETENIFLLFQLDEEKIIEYLTKSKSLRELIFSANIVSLITQNFNNEILDAKLIMPDFLPEDYLPDSKSFISYNPTKSSYYYEKINEFHRKSYLNLLRNNSFYIKFSSNQKKFGDTVGLNEISNVLLKNLSKSYKNFVEIEFEKEFGKIVPIDTEREKLFRQVVADTDLRMVDLKYGSFEIGFATDKLMKSNIQFRDLRKWADNVGDKYRQIVLDEDIDNSELEDILQNYSEEERNKIFQPILTIVDNPNFELKIKDRGEKDYSNLGVRKKDVSSKIVSKNVEKQKEEKDLTLVNVITIIDKKSNKKTVNLDNTLFSQVQEINYLLTNKDFYELGFERTPKDLKINMSLLSENNQIKLISHYDNEIFEVNVENDKIEEGKKKILTKIYEYLLNKE